MTIHRDIPQRRSIRHGCGRAGALTLVELIVAITLTVLVAGSTVTILRSVAASRQRVDQQLNLQQEARQALSEITSSLRNAYRSTRNDDWALEGIEEYSGEMPNCRIRFFTVSRKVVRLGEPEADVRECEFFLMQPETQGEQPASSKLLSGQKATLPVLMKRTDPTRNEEPDGRGMLEKVAENIVSLRFSYYSAGDWLTSWPTSSTEWPLAVKVELVVANPSDPSTIWAVDDIVNFPLRTEQPTTRSTSQPSDAASGSTASGSSQNSSSNSGSGSRGNQQ